MREIIPSLSMIYSITGILWLMLLIASISLYFNTRNEAAYRRTLFWSKLIISVPLLLLGVGWTIFATTGFGVAALIGSDLSQALFYLALALAPIVIYAITTWGLIRWGRNKRFSDVSVIIVIVIFVSFVLLFQRPWLCKPFIHIGIGSAQECTTQHDRELQDIQNSLHR